MACISERYVQDYISRCIRGCDCCDEKYIDSHNVRPLISHLVTMSNYKDYLDMFKDINLVIVIMVCDHKISVIIPDLDYPIVQNSLVRWLDYLDYSQGNITTYSDGGIIHIDEHDCWEGIRLTKDDYVINIMKVCDGDECAINYILYNNEKTADEIKLMTCLSNN